MTLGLCARADGRALGGQGKSFRGRDHPGQFQGRRGGVWSWWGMSLEQLEVPFVRLNHTHNGTHKQLEDETIVIVCVFSAGHY